MDYPTNELIAALKRPKAYPEKISNIKLVTTQMSAVFLTGKYAYKIKLPVNLGFLDYTTLEKRKHFCEEEIRLNKQSCPELYLGVVTVNKDNGNIRINGSGDVIEYAVKMLEVPQEKIMTALLLQGKISGETINDLALKVAEMHGKADRPEEISEYGNLETILFNWNENFEQTKEFKNIVGEERFDYIKTAVNGFIERNNDLFQKRAKEGCVRYCHGDLHTGNIFVDNGKVYVFDRIEFNLRFACSDVAADLAFLTMDLGFHGKNDFAEQLTNKYISLTKDKGIRELLPFYECYRAYIRGKINLLKIKVGQLTEKERNKAEQEAKKYFELAERYAEKL